jgi:hypothetical protein
MSAGLLELTQLLFYSPSHQATINSKHRENSAADTTLNQGWLRCGGAQEKPAGCSSACVVTEASSSDGSLCCYTSKVEI